MNQAATSDVTEAAENNKLLRYARHLLLEPFGLEAQKKLTEASVLVIGAGGLGAAALPYLAASGVGRIVVADGDTVDLTNLQRQVIHNEAAIGFNKAISAKKRLDEINSTILIEAIPSNLNEYLLDAHVSQADLVLDCSDNFRTRHDINLACVRHKKKLVSGAAIRFDGQVTSFDFSRHNSPCYACLFPAIELTPNVAGCATQGPAKDTLAGGQESGGDGDAENCATMGVLSPLVGVIGSMQAVEAIRLLSGLADTKQPELGRLQLFDARSFTWRELRFRRDFLCKVCGDIEASSAAQDTRNADASGLGNSEQEHKNIPTYLETEHA